MTPSAPVEPVKDALSNPLILIVAGAVATWIIQRLFNFIANPSKHQIELLTQAMNTKNESLTVAINNNTQAMLALTQLVNDHEARLSVVEDFKSRHDCKED